jgi:hypothetical protein
MSLAPGLALPARRAVSLLGETWLLGDPAVDGVFGKSIRQTVPMRRATEMFGVMTPAQTIVVDPGTQMYGRKDYLRDTVDGMTSSEYFPFYNLYFANTEIAPQPRSFFRGGDNQLYRCRSLYQTRDGMVCAQCDLIDKSAITYAELGSQVYDPVLDTYGTGYTQVPAMVMHPHQLYEKQSEADASFMAGDLTVLIRMADAIPTVGQTLNLRLGDILWIDPRWWAGVTPALILNVGVENDAYNLHIRKA